MIVLLAKEQALNLRIYRWLRGAGEMTSLARATAKQGDLMAEKFLTTMMGAHESVQDTTGETIRALASSGRRREGRARLHRRRVAA
jgi:hypothetical protein